MLATPSYLSSRFGSALIFGCLVVSLCLFLILLQGCSSQRQTPHEWVLQSQATAGSLDFVELLEMAEQVKLMSGGRLLIRPVPGGEVASGPDIYAAVSERRVEMGNGWPNWWSGRHPSWSVMNAGPFDFMNLDASMMFFLEGEGTALANELASGDGIIWRPAWWPGMEFGLLSKEPIMGLDDLKDKKVRIGPGLPGEVFTEASGAYTIPLVPEEMRPALEQGLIDAVEWTTARGVLDLNLHDVSPNAIVPAIWQPAVVSDFLINEAAYDELGEDLKAILESALKAYALTTTVKSKLADFDALEALKQANVNFHAWSKEDIERWRVANESILEGYRARDDYTKRLISEKQAFKERYNRYYEYFGAYD
ncbi:TRAP transporter substrate-binding protein DctP [Pelagicoccus sp. NFK12]|uniref:TRAP transporter substrate-binding protein DctP n=1 Tax=Pelagicoccus enzymogenes TaxID=2773457 RepID=A0A927IGT7_9BACT|nr:TRAP transporter substrate-binding protein DctP [Pelagicoccus enzymogenes]MBD5779023.1 TRAP transporter substrate-binding protein DctP [Pelagicoccus enzymogenes]